MTTSLPSLCGGQLIFGSSQPIIGGGKAWPTNAYNLRFIVRDSATPAGVRTLHLRTFVLRNACCRSRHGVEVRETTRQGKVGLGLFACRQFSPDSFVLPLSWYVKTGRGCHNPSLSVQSLTVSTRWDQFQFRNRGGWNISYGSWRNGAWKTEMCRIGSARH